MAKKIVENQQLMSAAREAINDNFTELYDQVGTGGTTLSGGGSSGGAGSLQVIKDKSNFYTDLPDAIVLPDTGDNEIILNLNQFISSTDEIYYESRYYPNEHKFISFKNNDIGGIGTLQEGIGVEVTSLSGILDEGRVLYYGGSSTGSSSTGGSSIVTGNYTGNGEDPQTIELGFRPAVVHIQCTSAPYYGNQTQIDGMGSPNKYYYKSQSSNTGNQGVENFIEITDTGFKVIGAINNSALNHSGSNYSYYAISESSSSSGGSSSTGGSSNFYGANIFLTQGTLAIKSQTSDFIESIIMVGNTNNYDITFKDGIFTEPPIMVSTAVNTSDNYLEGVLVKSDASSGDLYASGKKMTIRWELTSEVRSYMTTATDFHGANLIFMKTGADFDASSSSGGSSGGGSSTFAALTDTPTELTADKYLKVNTEGTALELVDAPVGSGGGSSEGANTAEIQVHQGLFEGVVPFAISALTSNGAGRKILFLDHYGAGGGSEDYFLYSNHLDNLRFAVYFKTDTVTGEWLTSSTITKEGAGSLASYIANGHAFYFGGGSSDAIKTWCVFNGDLGLGEATIRGGSNVASVLKIGTGQYKVTMTNPMPSEHYSVSVDCNPWGTSGGYGGVMYEYSGDTSKNPTTTTFYIDCRQFDGQKVSPNRVTFHVVC